MSVDQVWDTLKTFSLLVVRQRSGTMHRLLQQVRTRVCVYVLHVCACGVHAVEGAISLAYLGDCARSSRMYWSPIDMWDAPNSAPLSRRAFFLSFQCYPDPFPLFWQT